MCSCRCKAAVKDSHLSHLRKLSLQFTVTVATHIYTVYIDAHLYALTWLWVVFTSRCLGSNLGPPNHWRRGTTSVRHLCQCCKVLWWDPFCLFNSSSSHALHICLLVMIFLRSSYSLHPILPPRVRSSKTLLLFFFVPLQPFLHHFLSVRRHRAPPFHLPHPPQNIYLTFFSLSLA